MIITIKLVKTAIIPEPHLQVNSIMADNRSCTITDEEKFRILLAIGIGGIAAIVVCSIALAMALVFKLHRFLIHRLAMYQVLAALFFGVICALEMIFINYDHNLKVYRPLCMMTGFLLEYAVWVKLMIMLCLTFHLFCFAVCYTNFNRLELVYVLISVFSPLLCSWIPFIHRVYGEAGAWCWIQNWKGDCADRKLPDGEIEEYALFYGPAFVGLTIAALAVVILVVILAWRAYCQSNSKPVDDTTPLVSTEQRKKALREILPLVAYPLLFIVFLMPSFINRIRGAIVDDARSSSFMWSAVTTPCLSLFAGLTLIVHVIILKCPKHIIRLKCNSIQHYTTPTFNISNLFTSDTVASTTGRT